MDPQAPKTNPTRTAAKPPKTAPSVPPTLLATAALFEEARLVAAEALADDFPDAEELEEGQVMQVTLEVAEVEEMVALATIEGIDAREAVPEAAVAVGTEREFRLENNDALTMVEGKWDCPGLRDAMAEVTAEFWAWAAAEN